MIFPRFLFTIYYSIIFLAIFARKSYNRKYEIFLRRASCLKITHAVIIHQKKKKNLVIGASQTIDFEAIFNAAYKQGLEAYYVEIEANDIPPMECAEKSAEYLSAAKFVK